MVCIREAGVHAIREDHNAIHITKHNIDSILDQMLREGGHIDAELEVYERFNRSSKCN
jgi:hypothetical protein